MREVARAARSMSGSVALLVPMCATKLSTQSMGVVTELVTLQVVPLPHAISLSPVFL